MGRGQAAPGGVAEHTWNAALTYLGVVAALTWQALRGQSVIAPDRATLTLLASLLVVSLVVGTTGVLHAIWSARPTVRRVALQMT